MGAETWLKRFIILGLIIFFLATIDLLAGFNQIEDQCEGDTKETQQDKKQITLFGGPIFFPVRCLVSDAFANHHDVVIAVATVVLVLVTGVLAYVTGGLWNATVDLGRDAKKTSDIQAAQMAQSIKATQVIESPFLIPELTGMNHEKLEDGRIRPVATYVLRNNGRSPAILRRFQDTHIIREQLPDNYGDIWDSPLSTRPGQYLAIGPAHIQTSGQHFNCALILEDVGRQGGRQYVIGRFQFEDLFGTSYVQGFCIQILNVVPTGKDGEVVIHHVITGDNVYNYRREERAA